MKPLKLISRPQTAGGLHAQIEHDEIAGFYLYVFDVPNDEWYDYLQDTLDAAKEQAFEEFGVPMDSWVEAAD